MERARATWHATTPPAVKVGVYSPSRFFLAAAGKWLSEHEDIVLVVADDDPVLDAHGRPGRLDVVVLDGELLPPDPAPDVPAPRVVVVVRAGQSLPILSLLGAGVRGFVQAESCTADVLAVAVRAAAEGHLFVQNVVVDRLGDVSVRPQSIDRGRPDLVGLTEREHQILRLLATGRSNRQLATALDISERTVRFHLTNVFDKLGVGSRGEAIALAHRLDAP